MLVADAPDVDRIGETLSLIRTLTTHGSDLETLDPCPTLEAATERVREEVGHTYPSFTLRGLDWDEICAHHEPRVREAADPLDAMQEWLAELCDPHTWVRPVPPHLPLPYSLWLERDRAVFTRVSPGSVAWRAGVRPGDRLQDVDAAAWLRRTGAARHMHPFIAGYRLLSGPIGQERIFTARAPTGESHTWTEAPTPDLPYPAVSWRQLPSAVGYLRVEAWRADLNVDALIDEALADLAACKGLIVDLRANGGGNFLLALSFRDRFLREPAFMGSLRRSLPSGGLSAPQQIHAVPAPAHRRRHGEVRFLTDPLTYSASEDALLGLAGLPYVKVAGEPSGGGSGRPRSLPLLPGMRLTVSTVLTYNRDGRCIEGRGIPVDIPVSPDRFTSGAPDAVLEATDRSLQSSDIDMA